MKSMTVAAMAGLLLTGNALANTAPSNRADDARFVISASDDEPQAAQDNIAPQAPVTNEGDGPASWPSGADAIVERYENWTFECRMIDARARCSINQKLANQLGMELFTSEDGNEARGVLILPFGLQVTQGAAIIVDGKPADHRVPFSTCMPQGCLVPLSMPARSMERIMQAKELRIVSFDSTTGAKKEFLIPLDGMNNAFNRLIDYSRHQ